MTYQLPPESQDTIPHSPQGLRVSPWFHLAFILGCLGVLVATIGFFAYLLSLTETTPVTVVIGGEARPVETRAQTVHELLENLGITIHEGDRLSVPETEAISDGLVLQVDRARSVTVSVDDQTRVYRTIMTNPQDILSGAGISLIPDDLIVLDGTEVDASALRNWPVPVNQITIRRSVSATVQIGDRQSRLKTTAATVGDMLYDAGIPLYLADTVLPELSSPVVDGMIVTVHRSRPATISVDGQSIEVRTRGETVGDLLADAGVALMGLDYSIPSEDIAVRAGMIVRVIRVEERVESDMQAVPFESISRPEPTLELDQGRLTQPGSPGTQRIDHLVRYENGVPVERFLLGQMLVVPPTNRIATYGTGVVLRTVDTERGPQQYWRQIRMLATSYHPAALGGDDVTATGRKLTKGVVAVDPGVIPYGTEVYVPGYGIGIAADTGGPRSTRRWIDLGYDDDNFEPWSRWVDVYVLAPAPNNIPYILPE